MLPFYSLNTYYPYYPLTTLSHITPSALSTLAPQYSGAGGARHRPPRRVDRPCEHQQQNHRYVTSIDIPLFSLHSCSLCMYSHMRDINWCPLSTHPPFLHTSHPSHPCHPCHPFHPFILTTPLTIIICRSPHLYFWRAARCPHVLPAARPRLETALQSAHHHRVPVRNCERR